MLTHLQTLARMAKNQCSDSGLSSPGGLRGWCQTIAHLPRGLSWAGFPSFHSVAFLVQCLLEASQGQSKTVRDCHFIKIHATFTFVHCAFSSDADGQVDPSPSTWLVWRSGKAEWFKFYLHYLLIFKKAISECGKAEGEAGLESGKSQL